MPSRSNGRGQLPALRRDSVADQLHRESGLPITRLAELFDISRATYHNWLNGVLPHGKRRERLLRVATLTHEALDRFQTPSRVAIWLDTPLSAGGPTPFDLLKHGDFPTFRGVIYLGEPGSPRGPVTRSTVTARQLQQQRAWIAPAPWQEDLDATLPTDDDFDASASR